VQRKVLAIKTAHAPKPGRGNASALPGLNLGAKLGIAGGKVLRTVVALPALPGVIATARAHAACGTTAFVKHMHQMPSLGQRLGAAQAGHACTHNGNGCGGIWLMGLMGVHGGVVASKK
jgi:hypothetical protein